MPQRVATPWGLADLDLRRRLDPDAFDPTLKSLFAPPDWQALDLTKLLLFLLLYHGAFLARVPAPARCSTRTSRRAVYLVSVGTVMVVVVGVGLVVAAPVLPARQPGLHTVADLRRGRVPAAPMPSCASSAATRR